MIINKKSSLILILKVLEEYSDEDHLLTQQQIIDKISQYANGIAQVIEKKSN